LMCRGREARIASPTTPALRHHDPLIGPRKIVYLLSRVGVVQNRAHWYFQDYVYAFAPGAIRTFAVTSALGFVFRIETKMDQRVMTFAGFHDDVATLPPVSARRASAGDKLLPPESEASVATVACFHSNFGFINEHGGSGQNSRQKKCLVPKATRLRATQIVHTAGSKILFRFQRLDHHKLAHRTFVEKFDPAADLSEERVVLATTHIQARLHPRTALTDDDRPAGNDLSPESLETQTLRIRVATVS